MIRRMLLLMRRRAPEPALPDPVALRPVAPLGEHWVVLAANEATHSRAGDWVRGLAAEGVRVSLSCREEIELPSGAKSLGWSPAAWRTAIGDPLSRQRVLALLPDPAVVAFAREARAAGARVVYDKIAPVDFTGSSRPFHPEDEKALVGGCDDRVAGDGATARLLASLGGQGGLVHEIASAASGASGLRSVLEKPTMTLVVVADPSLAQVEASVDRWIAARGLHAYRIAVVVGPGEGAALEQLLAREALGDLRLLRDPRGTLGSAAAMGVRATGGEVVAVVAAEQSPHGEEWLGESLVEIHSDAGLGALVLADGDSAGSDVSSLPLFGWVARRGAVLDAGGVAEDFASAAATAADFSLRLARRGFRIARQAPTISGTPQGVATGAEDRDRLARRWPTESAQLGALYGAAD